MKLIIDLMRLIDRPADVISINEDLTEDLFIQIRDGVVSEKEDGEALYYAGKQFASQQFSSLRKDLEGRLVNTLIATKKVRERYYERQSELEKALIACSILWGKGKASSAAELAKKILKNALHFHLTEVAVACTRRLMHHYASRSPNIKKHREYKNRLKQYEEALRIENLAFDHFNEISLKVRNAKTVSLKLIDTVQVKKEEVDKYFLPNIRFQHSKFNIHLAFFLLTNNSSEVTNTCQKALKFIDDLSFDPPDRFKRSYYLNLIPVYIQSNQFEQAQLTIEQVKKLIHSKQANWIGIHQFQAILGFYAEDLGKVRSSIKSIKESPLHRLIEEELLIYQTYIDFLEGKKNYKLGKFLNQVPKYSTDKKGMNINILILQVLIYLQRNDRPAIIERLEALQAYAYRYLKNDPTTKRSEIFFRMIFLLARSAFELSGVEKRSPGIFMQLKNTPRHISAVDIEVVPYEVLWKRIEEST